MGQSVIMAKPAGVLRSPAVLAASPAVRAWVAMLLERGERAGPGVRGKEPGALVGSRPESKRKR